MGAFSQTDFVEATVFTEQEAVVMKCDFVDGIGSDGSVDNVQTWYKRFFYTHIRAVLEHCVAQGKDTYTAVDYIPTLQYIFRHAPAIFWTMRDQLPEHIGNNPVVRLLFGWMYPPKVTFLKLPATPKIKHEMMFGRVYQDIVLPLSTLEEQIEKAGRLFKVWPILVYPSRIYTHGNGKQGIFPKPDEKDLAIVDGVRQNYAMYNDLGVYGTPEGALTPQYLHVHACAQWRISRGPPRVPPSCMRTPSWTVGSSTQCSTLSCTSSRAASTVQKATFHMSLIKHVAEAACESGRMSCVPKRHGEGRLHGGSGAPWRAGGQRSSHHEWLKVSVQDERFSVRLSL